MTREMILRNRLEMASHNLDCYSADYLGATPKEGMEKEHAEAAAEVEVLEAWLKEFHSSRTDSTREFIGTINGWCGCSTWDGKPMARDLRFDVDIGIDFDGDERQFGIGPEVMDWFIGENDGCGRYDIEKDRRYGPGSRLIKITVDRINYVRSVEWVEAE
jgi:hypothetical protein